MFFPAMDHRDRFFVAAFAAEHHHLQGFEDARAGVGVVGEKSRGDEITGDAPRAQLPFEQVARQNGGLIEDLDPATGEQHAPHLEENGVERSAGPVGHDVVFAKFMEVVVEQKADDAGLRDRHTLRAAGRAGSKKNGRGQQGVGRGQFGCRSGQIGEQIFEKVDLLAERGAGFFRQRRPHVPSGEDPRVTTIFVHGREAGRWIRRIHRCINAAGFEHAEAGEHLLDRTFEAKADTVAGF